MRSTIFAAAMAVALAGGGVAARGPSAGLGAFDVVPGAALPILKSHDYVMDGAVRPLLFWVGRDDIGMARIVWRADASGARGYELLVGTDPGRAPRGLNRWGLISEEARGTEGSVLAFMTGSHDTSYKAEASAAGVAKSDFRAIQARTSGGTAEWQLASLRTSQVLTVRQSAEAIACLRRDGSRSSAFRRTVTNDVRPGFLVAVAQLLDETLTAAAKGATSSTRTIRYVFGNHTYDLRLRDVKRVTFPYAGRDAESLRTRFETRTVETGETTWFELTTATTGDLAGVPLQIEWQPRWWLRVRLHLAPPSGG